MRSNTEEPRASARAVLPAAPAPSASTPARPPEPPASAYANVLLVTFAVIIGACSPTATKAAVNELPPFTLMAGRFLGITILMWSSWPLLRRFDRPRAPVSDQRPRIAGEDYLSILAAAIVYVPINQSLFLNGLRFGTATHAGLLAGLNPLFTYLLTWITGAGLVNRRMSLAVILGFAGASTMGWESARGHSAGGSHAWFGDLLVVGSVLTWAGYSVLTLPLSLRYGPIRFLLIVTTIGSILAAPLALIDVHQLDLSRVTPAGWGGFAFMVIGTGFINAILWFIGATRMDINRFVLAMNANPILAVFIAHFAHKEPLTAGLAAGGVLIVSAILMANWDKLRALTPRRSVTG